MKTFVLCLLVVATALAAPSSKPQFKRGMDKIVGGSDVAPGQLPYQISLKRTRWLGDYHYCGASIYSERWIITAAQCVRDENLENPSGFLIVAGDNDLGTYEAEREQTVYPEKIILHEDYDVETITNDIALIKIRTSGPLKFNDYVQPIALPDQMQDFTGVALISGWGSLSEGGWNPAILQSASVPIVSDEKCRLSYGDKNVDDSMICAGDDSNGPCYGDSGSPMTCTSGDSTYLCGIISWGIGCARPRFPGVYTEVSYFVDWIHTNTGKDI